MQGGLDIHNMQYILIKSIPPPPPPSPPLASAYKSIWGYDVANVQYVRATSLPLLTAMVQLKTCAGPFRVWEGNEKPQINHRLRLSRARSSGRWEQVVSLCSRLALLCARECVNPQETHREGCPIDVKALFPTRGYPIFFPFTPQNISTTSSKILRIPLITGNYRYAVAHIPE